MFGNLKRGAAWGHPWATLAALVLPALLADGAACGAESGVTGLGAATPILMSIANGVSADGSVVVGEWQNVAGYREAFTWEPPGLAVGLGIPPGYVLSVARAVSGDGAVVAGTIMALPPGSTPVSRAVVWKASVMTNLGTAPGFDSSDARALSSDGSIVVGSLSGGVAREAFRWKDGVMTPLGSLNPGGSSVANGVSGDGRVVVGQSWTGAGSEAFRWTSDDNRMVGLGRLGGTGSVASAVSADGGVIAGSSEYDGTGAQMAFIWKDGVMTGLGTLGGRNSTGNAISGDGRVVVGTSRASSGALTAFRWSQNTLMLSVGDWLARAGVNTGGWHFAEASAANRDGSVVVGYGDLNGATTAFLARVSATGNGVLSDLGEFNSTLGRIGATAPQMLAGMTVMAMSGAHHRPLVDSGLPGNACAWGTVDSARQPETGLRMNLEEAGACADLGPVRLGAGVGHAQGRQGGAPADEARYRGDYLVVEGGVRTATGLAATLIAQYGRWNGRLTRAYRNGAVLDASTGESTAESVAVRGRVDWFDAVRLGEWALSPFVSLGRERHRQDAYTETGGGFPAYFDVRAKRADELRAGATVRTALGPATDLRLTGEAIHRREPEGSGITGKVLGLWSFAFRDTARSETSRKFGAELDHRLTPASMFTFSAGSVPSGRDRGWVLSLGLRFAL